MGRGSTLPVCGATASSSVPIVVAARENREQRLAPPATAADRDFFGRSLALAR